MVFYGRFSQISVISRRPLSLFMSFLGFTSTRLGSEVSCLRTLPRKKERKNKTKTQTKDLVRLEPRIPTSRALYHRATQDHWLIRIHEVSKLVDGVQVVLYADCWPEPRLDRLLYTPWFDHSNCDIGC